MSEDKPDFRGDGWWIEKGQVHESISARGDVWGPPGWFLRPLNPQEAALLARVWELETALTMWVDDLPETLNLWSESMKQAWELTKPLLGLTDYVEDESEEPEEDEVF